MPDTNFTVNAQPMNDQVKASYGPVSILLGVDEAHHLIDLLRDALRDLAEKGADRD